jgi:acetate kinase
MNTASKPIRFILALNCGSSSVKGQLYDWGGKKVLRSWNIQKIGKNYRGGLQRIINEIDNSHVMGINSIKEISAIGHRIVHGGETFTHSALVDNNVIKEIEKNSLLAPLHNPANLEGIRAAKDFLPDVPNMAVFDTAFHQTMPPYNYTYALPLTISKEFGIRRYGFHGTSHLYVSRRAARALEKPLSELKIFTGHQGSGASYCGILDGKSYITSMGLTPLEGAVMGTRAGDIDPGILFHIVRQYINSKFKDKNRTISIKMAEKYINEMDTLLNKKSGLKGFTGTDDWKEIVEKGLNYDLPEQKMFYLAMQMATERFKHYVGGYAARLGGLDAIVFTAGVGENCPIFRSMSLAGLDFMGIKIDNQANHGVKKGEEAIISSPDSKVKILVIPTNEERVIIEDTAEILSRGFIGPDFRYTFEDIPFPIKL